MKSNDNSSLNVLGAFISGGLIGAGAALLFAPRSGKETRQSLSRIEERAQNELNICRAEFSEKIERIFSDFQADLKTCVNDGKNWTEEKKSEITLALQKNKRKIEIELDRILHSFIP